MKYFFITLILFLIFFASCGDSEAPEVHIINPVSGATVSGTVSVAAIATDNDDIDRIEFFIDDTCESIVTTAPFVYQWDCSALPDSSTHSIYVTAFDLSENSTTTPTITVTIGGC